MQSGIGGKKSDPFEFFAFLLSFYGVISGSLYPFENTMKALS